MQQFEPQRVCVKTEYCEAPAALFVLKHFLTQNADFKKNLKLEEQTESLFRCLIEFKYDCNARKSVLPF